MARAEDLASPEHVPPSNAEKYDFQAEVHRMLDIVINSLYQHNDIFLRELISNASDALDKIRYLLLTDPDNYKSKDAEDIKLEVQIEYDADAHTLTIRDTGVGMTHDDLVANLGTVARSGTTKFIEALKESGNDAETMSQIGQFGVGFYSSFLVADKVVVASKHPTSDTQYVWESDNGVAEFRVYPDSRGNTLKRGTEITLHLKDDMLEYTDAYKLKNLVKHYSEFVVHPISLRTTETVEVEIDDEDEEGEKAEDDEAKKKEEKSEDDLDVSEDEDGDKDESEKPKKTKPVTTFSWEVVNGNPAIWTREKEDISDDEYQGFYHVLADDDASNATTWSHFNAEGNINFKSLLYLPSEIPASYRYGNMDSVPGAIKLYVRKVLIGDDFELLPKYLGFIRGVIDSDDLPLNVNRETLQESKILQVIRKKVARKAIDMIRHLAKGDEEGHEDDSEGKAEAEIDADGNVVKNDKDKSNNTKYIEWYKKFSPNIKLGILDDYANQAKLVKLLRYETSKSNGTLISLDDYEKNMKEWQKDIYVLGCLNSAECASSPFLETFKEKDVEVLFLTDAIDEYMIKQVRTFDGKKLVQISSENVKLNDEDEDLVKRREKVYQKKFQPLTKWLRKLYSGSVLRVQVAKRSLGSVPAIVSSSDYGNSANMERILKAQAFQHGVDPSSMMSMKIFEINPRHPLIIKLLEGCPPEDAKDDDESEDKFVVDPSVVDAAWMIHDMAMLNGGFPIPNPERHNKRLMKILKKQFALESLSLEPEINPPLEEDTPPDAEGAGGLNMDDFNMDNMDFDNLNLDDLKAQMNAADIDMEL
jgi:heat shock protein beta